MKTCEHCKHLRRMAMLGKDDQPFDVYYCHAISSYPIRSIDYPACKKYRVNSEELSEL